MNSAKMGCTQSGIQRRGRHTGSSSSRTPVAPATPVFSGDGEEALLKTSDGTSTTTSTRGCGVLSNSKHHSDGNSLKVKPLERPVNHGSVNECSVPLFSSTERSHDDGWVSFCHYLFIHGDFLSLFLSWLGVLAFSFSRRLVIVVSICALSLSTDASWELEDDFRPMRRIAYGWLQLVSRKDKE